MVISYKVNRGGIVYYICMIELRDLFMFIFFDEVYRGL